jgi:hypothetical protein
MLSEEKKRYPRSYLATMPAVRLSISMMYAWVMSALSPDDRVFLSGLVMAICFEQEDQRQAPVAAEKQRSVTH